MRFNTTVEGARWDEDAKLWRVALAGGETLSTRYLITATGFLSQPQTPDIPGIDDFAGKVIHTTDWDDSYDADGPADRDHRHRRHRRPAHPRARQDGRRPDRLPAHPDLGGAQDRLAVLRAGQAAVRPSAADPAGDPRGHRRHLRGADQLRRSLHHRHASAGSTSPRPTWPRCTGSRRSATRSCATSSRPDYDFGCKRPTFSNGYYRAFTKPHVHLQTDGIDHIEADGIVNADGTKTVIDTLVLATGFDLWEANFPAIEVIGREGRNLGKWWRDNQIPGLPGRVDAVLPELPEPGQPVRVPRVELLQHDGIPDAAHGPAVQRGQAPRAPPRSR